ARGRHRVDAGGARRDRFAQHLLADGSTETDDHAHSATIRPVVCLLKSSRNGYVPGLSARMRTLTVLPAGTTFSVRRSLLSNSAALSPLFVMTRMKGVLAFTLIITNKEIGRAHV